MFGSRQKKPRNVIPGQTSQGGNTWDGRTSAAGREVAVVTQTMSRPCHAM
jgi:hypothetical protein